MVVEPFAILAKILPGRRHKQGPLPQQRQIIRDVGRAAATLLLHGFDQETQADVVQLIRQDVLAEAAGKRHDVIKRNGTGDDDCHPLNLILKITHRACQPSVQRIFLPSSTVRGL